MNLFVVMLLGLSVVLLIWLPLSAIRVVQPYERGVIFVLGRLIGAKGPGLFLVPPFISRMLKIDLRIVTLTVPPQEVITRDNVTIKVTAVIYFYVVDPVAAVVKVVNFNQATPQIGQTTLRNVLGQSELDELLAERNKINRELQAIIDEQTEQWGVKVTAVEIKDIEMPATMQRAMAKQAEAEREKRAKVIHAKAGMAGLDPTRSGCRSHRLTACHAATALPANPDRDRGGEELDHYLPAAHRPDCATHSDPAPSGKRAGPGTSKRFSSLTTRGERCQRSGWRNRDRKSVV